jgi:hypothetical protein
LRRACKPFRRAGWFTSWVFMEAKWLIILRV